MIYRLTPLDSKKKTRSLIQRIYESALFRAIGVGVTLFFGVWEFSKKSFDQRVSQSAEQIKNFFASDGYKHLLALEDLWFGEKHTQLRVQTENLYNEIVSGSASEPARSALRVFNTERYNENLSKNLFDLNDKFPRIIQDIKIPVVCGIQRTCDRQSICMHLANRYFSLRCNFRHKIKEINEKTNLCLIDELNYFFDNNCQEWRRNFLGISTYKGIKDDYCIYTPESKKLLIGESCANDSLIHKEKSGILSPLYELIHLSIDK